MRFCPQCGSELAPGTSTCMSCAKMQASAADNASGGGKWGELDLGADLDSSPLPSVQTTPVEPSPTPAQQQKAPAQTAPTSSTMDTMEEMHGGVFDDPLSAPLDESENLELTSLAPAQEDPAKVKAQKEARERARKRERVIQIANFGYPPSNLLESLVYAIRVLWRRLRLLIAIRKLRNKQAHATDIKNKAMRVVGDVMYAHQGDEELLTYEDKIQTVTDARMGVQQTADSKQQARASAAEQMKEIMESIKQVHQRIEPLRAHESELLVALEKCEGIRQKHQAVMDRAEEEHKALLKNTTGTPDPNWLASVEQQRQARLAKIKPVLDRIQEINNRLKEVHAKISERQAEIEKLHDRRKSIHTEMARTEHQHEMESEQKHARLEGALIRLGEAGLQNNLQNIAVSEIQEARKAIDVVKNLDYEIHLHEHAIDSYERGGFTRGLVLLITSLVAVIALAFVASQFIGSSANETEPDTMEQAETSDN